MVFAYPLVRGNVAEHVILLLVGSSHADWTYQALLRCKLFAFFSKLLGPKVRANLEALASSSGDAKHVLSGAGLLIAKSELEYTT